MDSERHKLYHYRPRSVGSVVAEIVTIAIVITAIAFALWMSTLRG